MQKRADRRRLGQRGTLLLFLGVLILIMVGLRYEVGGDWFTYVEIFNAFRRADLGVAISTSDPGYSLLNWIAAQLGWGIWFVNLACALLFTWGLLRFAAEQPNPWLVLVVAIPYLVIVVAMGYTRQAVAIGFILSGLAALRRNRSIARFGFYIVAAALFHRTAIIVLPLVALAGTHNKWITAALGAALGAILFYFLINPQFDTLFENYVTDEYDAQGAMIRVLMNVVPAILFLAFQRRLSFDEADRKLWRNFAYAALVALLMLFVLNSSVVIDRLALYIIPLQLAILSRLPLAFPKERQPDPMLTIAVIAYSATVQFVWLTMADHAQFWVPYKFYFL